MGNYGRLPRSTTRKNIGISMAYGCTIDTNTYCYRLIDGKQVFNRVKLGRGWAEQPFDVTKLSCYEKGEDSMAGKTGYHKQWLPWDELMPKVKELQAQGYETPVIAQRLGIKKDTLWKRIALEKKRSQTPDPGGGQPDPAQETQEPANNSIPEKEITVKDVLMYELEQKEAQYAPTDNDYSDEPQRTTMTRAQYDAMAMNDGRRSALSLFCENKAVEDLFQGWAVDVFKHVVLSRERKLELIGQLLDWRAGA